MTGAAREPQRRDPHGRDGAEGGSRVAAHAAPEDGGSAGTSAVSEPGRLAAVAATGLLDTAPEEAFDRLTRLAADLLDAPMVFVTLVDDQRAYWKSHAVPASQRTANTPGTDDVEGGGAVRETAVGESFCRLVVDSGSELTIADTHGDERVHDLEAVATMSIRAWAGIPIRDGAGHVLGTFCALDTTPRDWPERDLEVLRTLAQAAGGEIALRVALRASQQAYAEAERHAERAERHAAEATELAETLQQSLLPAASPRIPGMELAARYRPGGRGAEVLGDFYDVFPVPGGWGVVIGDVAGKGAWAARTTALARSTARAVGHTAHHPDAVLAALNDVLHVWFAGRRSFVTASYATLTAGDDGLDTHVCNGGHPPAFLLRADGEVRQFSEGGRALGLAPDPVVACEQDCLHPGDSLVFYTDGVTESRPPGRPADQFGEDGIAQTLADLPPGVNAETIADAISTAALDHAGGTVPDDTAIVVVRSPHITPVLRATAV